MRRENTKKKSEKERKTKFMSTIRRKEMVKRKKDKKEILEMWKLLSKEEKNSYTIKAKEVK